MLAVALDVAEAVRPDARTGVHRDAIPDARAAVDRDRRVELRSGADAHAGADDAVRTDDRRIRRSRTPSPSTTYGPTDTSRPSRTPLPTTAVGCTPRGAAATRWKRGRSDSSASCGLSTTTRDGTRPGVSASSGEIRTTPAFDVASIGAYFATPRKVRCRCDARSSGATPSTTVDGSPTS